MGWVSILWRYVIAADRHSGKIFLLNAVVHAI